MELMEMARFVGIRARNSEEVKRFEEAKKAYVECAELKDAFFEYEAQQKVLEKQRESEQIDEVFVSKVDARLNEIYDFITKHPLFVEYEQAQNEVNKLVNNMMEVIVEEVTGESSCTHDCSTCSGCSSSTVAKNTETTDNNEEN
jgi:cell fate (sporulation/competence/biofilm development) regulator YmcA (YheA/YmcA/DUF963 family)